MAPLPVEQTGESSAGDLQKSLPTPFLTKTYNLVEDLSIDDMISWNEDGTTFIVWRPAEFARDLLPKYFKHNNFSSFVRQLNTYGFRKVVPDRWEFAHECFRRGQKVLLRDIQRRKISLSPAATSSAAGQPVAVPVPVPPAVQVVSPANSSEEQVLSSNSSPAATATANVHRGTAATATATATATSTTPTPELLEENERLRRENTQLSHDLNRLRSLCSNICSLMSNFTTGQQPDTTGVMPERGALDLLPARQSLPCSAGRADGSMAEEDLSPRLFGVSIGVKRVRRSEGEEEDENHKG